MVDRKEARRIYKSYGGRISATQDRAGTYYDFPDGARFAIGEHDNEKTLGMKVRELRARYGTQRSSALEGLEKVGNHPRLDLERLTASGHAKERLALMQSQRKVTFQDVLHTITLPERVMWSDRHESWVWIREPLAVAVRENHSGAGHTITTVLWSDNDLFQLHPRPEASHG